MNWAISSSVITIFARSFFPTPRYFQVVTAATVTGGAWYAVCVRRVKNVDHAAEELTELVLRGVLV
jgi:hypothetical protein